MIQTSPSAGVAGALGWINTSFIWAAFIKAI